MKNKIKSPIQIENIKLENFQSLNDITEIPIKKLTFLYGPNSAGKSAIYDSLVFLDAVLNGSGKEIENYLTRWVYFNNKRLNDNPLKVEVRFLSPGIFSQNSFDSNAEVLPLEILNKRGIFALTDDSPGRVEISFVASAADRGYFSFIEKFSLSVDGLSVMEIYSGDEYNSDGPTLRLFPKIFGESLRDLVERHGFDKEDDNSFISTCWIELEPFRLEAFGGVGSSHDLNRDLICIANFFLAGLSTLSFAPDIVMADRGEIPNTTLSSICNCSATFFEETRENPIIYVNPGLGLISTHSPNAAKDHLSRMSSDVVESVILSRAEEDFKNRLKYIFENRPDLFRNLGNDSNLDFSNDSESLYAFVNRCLSDHLFVDQGYQIVVDLCEILPSNANILANQMPQADSDYYGRFRYNFSVLAICYLIDKKGRHVTFQDVGTGISCVLPVLVALNSLNSFIQQPELHLHPALQSSLGDILIESVKKYKSPFHIIESHSEYLLLRCLRRIRETTNGKRSKDDMLSLNPTDVSVLYFDPQPDGSTKVKQLRVSSQGDFLDRWPRGFFDERGKDLFDE